MQERAIKLVPSPGELLSDQVAILETFFGKEAIPEPPKTLLEFIERTTEQGFTFEAYFEPKVVFTQDSNYPGWRFKPSPWFWEQIKEGHISADAAILAGQWAAMEALPKPEYADGKQLYENDPLASILEKLRKDGKIAVSDRCAHIPSISRFGVSWDEIKRFVVPRFAKLTQIKAEQTGVPPYMAFNFRGNIAHQEWAKTNTWEWFANRFGGGRLVGGGRDDGGLSHVRSHWPGNHDDDIGFRLRVVFPL